MLTLIEARFTVLFHSAGDHLPISNSFISFWWQAWISWMGDSPARLVLFDTHTHALQLLFEVRPRVVHLSLCLVLPEFCDTNLVFGFSQHYNSAPLCSFLLDFSVVDICYFFIPWLSRQLIHCCQCIHIYMTF